MATHRLDADDRTVRVGVIDAAHPPVLTIDSGDTVELATLSHWGGRVVPPMTLAEVLELRADAPLGPHSLTGPIAVRGAEPGQVLRVDVGELVCGGWGFNLALPAPLGRGLLADRYPDGFLRHLELDPVALTTEIGPGITIALSPFLGIMGVAPADDGPHSSVPPGPYGGNLDLKDLVAGASLFLPVFRPGAGFYAGDAHAAQGDGEVDQTAIETSMTRAVLRFEVTDIALPEAMRRPWAETDDHLVALGLDEDLDVACVAAVDALVWHLTHRFGIDPDDAYALASIGADLEVTQAVNRVKGAHIAVPWETFGATRT